MITATLEKPLENQERNNFPEFEGGGYNYGNEILRRK